MSETTFVAQIDSYGGGTSFGAGTITPASGEDLILVVLTDTTNPPIPTVTNNLGSPILEDVAFTVGSNNLGFGVWRVHNPQISSQSFTIDWGVTVYAQYWTIRANTVGMFGQVAPLATGTSLSPLTNSLTPAQSGALLLAFVLASGSQTFGTPTNSFTAIVGRTSGPSIVNAYLTQVTANSVDCGIPLSASDAWSAYLLSYYPINTFPTITSVNSSSPIAEGSPGIPLIGTNFASGMTAAITQPNGVSVAQSNVTVTSSTAATFDLVMEPPVTDQLAFTDSTYVTNLVITVNGQSSQPVPVTLTPSSSQPFQTLGMPNPIPEQRIAAIPDLVAGDQLEAAGDATGTTAPPAGTVLHSDGSFEASADFWVRAYIQADAAWTPWALITVSPAQPGQGFFEGV